MTTRKQQLFINSQIAWMTAALIFLTLFGSLSLELYFVLSLLGFLIIVELTAPFNITIRWRKRLKWIIAAGILVFGYVVVKRVLEILPPGVF
ncbi:MAG: hypothetical protein ABEK59_09190 [Halobacteria archaeon]